MVGCLVYFFINKGYSSKNIYRQKNCSWSAGEEAEIKVDVAKYTGKVSILDLDGFCSYRLFASTYSLLLVTEPLNKFLSQIFEFAPQLIGAVILIFIAWLIATVVRLLL